MNGFQFAEAGQKANPHTGKPDLCSTIVEEDGSPSMTACQTLEVTNGTLTDDGDGAFSLTTGGGGGNSFETIDTPAGTDPVADSSTDTLAITETSFLTVTGDSATDTIDITQVTTDLGTDGLIAANAVALGTDTTNAYVTDLTAGTYIDVSGGGAETATVTVDVDATEIEAVTFGAGGNASNAWTVNLSGTDPVATWGSDALTLNAEDLTVQGAGPNLVLDPDTGDSIGFHVDPLSSVGFINNTTDAVTYLTFNGANHAITLGDPAKATTTTVSSASPFHAASGVRFSSLRNCNTLDTDNQGVLSCGSDEGGVGGSGDIEAVGDCTTGACFTGVSGTTLTPSGGALTVSGDLTVSDASPYTQWTDTTSSEDDFEAYADGNQWVLSNVTDSVELLRFNHLNRGFFTNGNITIGNDTNRGQLTVDGDADEIQVLVQGNSTQTSPLITLENSAGTDMLSVSNTGNITMSGGADIRPDANSATAINIANAAGTDFVSFDTSTRAVVISSGGTASPKLSVTGDSSNTTAVFTNGANGGIVADFRDEAGTTILRVQDGSPHVRVADSINDSAGTLLQANNFAGAAVFTVDTNGAVVLGDADSQDTSPFYRFSDTTASEDDFEISVDGNMLNIGNVTDGIPNIITIDHLNNVKNLRGWTQSKSTVVTDLVAADDNVPLGSFHRDTVVTLLWCHCYGTCTTPAQITLEDDAGNAMTGTATCRINGGAATPVQISAGGALVPYEGLRFDVANTPDPTTDDYEISFSYSHTAN